MENGELGFTRNGNFKVDNDSRLVTMEGYPVLGIDDFGNTVDIYVENNRLNVDNKGEILGQDIRFQMVDFLDYSNLTIVGDTIFTNNQGDYNIIQADIRQRF